MKKNDQMVSQCNGNRFFNKVISDLLIAIYRINSIHSKKLKKCVALVLLLITCNKLYSQVTANAGQNDSISITPLSIAHLNGSGTGTGTLIYAWHPGAGLSDSTIANPDAKPMVTTIYTLTVTDGTGGSANDDVQIKVLSLPTVDAGNSASLCSCPNSYVVLNGIATSSCMITYEWSPTIGLSNPYILNPIAQPVSTTTYTLTVTDCFGAVASDAVTIIVTQLISITAPHDTTLCVGESVLLTPAIANGCGNNTFIWMPATGLQNSNIVNPVCTPSQTTTYTITGVDCCGCTAMDTVTISVDPPAGLPLVNISGDTLCSNYATGNQWYNSLGIILGATDQCYITSDTGIFYVLVNGVNCDVESPFVHKSVFSSIRDDNRDVGISIFPNPNNGSFLFSGVFNNNDINIISIYDSKGKIVYFEKQKITGNIKHIDISDMPEGVYSLKILSENIIYRTKIVIAK